MKSVAALVGYFVIKTAGLYNQDQKQEVYLYCKSLDPSLSSASFDAMLASPDFLSEVSVEDMDLIDALLVKSSQQMPMAKTESKNQNAKSQAVPSPLQIKNTAPSPLDDVPVPESSKKKEDTFLSSLNFMSKSVKKQKPVISNPRQENSADQSIPAPQNYTKSEPNLSHVSQSDYGSLELPSDSTFESVSMDAIDIPKPQVAASVGSTPSYSMPTASDSSSYLRDDLGSQASLTDVYGKYNNELAKKVQDVSAKMSAVQKQELDILAKQRELDNLASFLDGKEQVLYAKLVDEKDPRVLRVCTIIEEKWKALKYEHDSLLHKEQVLHLRESALKTKEDSLNATQRALTVAHEQFNQLQKSAQAQAVDLATQVSSLQSTVHSLEDRRAELTVLVTQLEQRQKNIASQLNADSAALQQEKEQLRRGLSELDGLKASLSQKHELHLHQKRSFEEEFAKKEATLHQTHTQKMQALALKERQLQEKTMLLQRQLKDLSTSQEQLRVLTQAASLNQKKQPASLTYSDPLQTRQVVTAQVSTRTSDARPLSQVPLPSFPPVMPSTSRTSPTTQQNKISQVIPTQSFNDIPSISSDMTSMPIEYGTDPANPHQASRASALDFLIELAYTAYDVDKARALETYNQIRSIYASLPPHEKKRVHTKILSLHKRLIA